MSPEASRAAVAPGEPDAAAPAEREPVLSVRGVSKAYQIYARPSDRLKAMLFGGKRHARRFWALGRTSFDVYPGEAVGVIGRNGAGKSTLMQIIAGTLTPTTGEVRIRGRIAALLELGSGFNPHFTGRENVYLYGAILGISKREMDARFAEIEEFAEIGEFIDQPLASYSSGMHARLAFSVAISVRPDILILDEILAVGDAAFQQKCVARLRGLLESGVTLLFVSHQADAVKSICGKGLLLARGKRAFFGSAEQAVDLYFETVRSAANLRATRRNPELAEPVPVAQEVASALRYGTGHAQFETVRVLNDAGEPAEAFAFGERVTVEATVRAFADLERLDVVIRLRDKAGVDLFGMSVAEAGGRVPDLREGQAATVRMRFVNALKAGPHGVCVTVTRRPDAVGEGVTTLDHLDACAAFTSLYDGRVRVRGKIHVPMEAEVEVEDRRAVGQHVAAE